MLSLLGAFFLTKAFSDDCEGGFAIFISVCIGWYAYDELTNYLIKNYTQYLPEMFVGFLMLLYSIYKFSFMVGQSYITRWGVHLILVCINTVLCVALSIVFFNYIGGTPFAYLIKWLNLGNWQVGTFLKIIEWIMNFTFSVLDLITNVGFFYLLHKFIETCLQSKMNCK